MRLLKSNLTPRRRGFSLAELMFAMAILGIGMVMAATMFATGLKNSKSSVDDTVGTMICSDAFSTILAACTHADMDANTNLSVFADAKEVDVLPAMDRVYPQARRWLEYDPDADPPIYDAAADWHDPEPANLNHPKGRRGWVALAKQYDPNGTGRNDYTFVIIAYQCTDPLHKTRPVLARLNVRIWYDEDEDDPNLGPRMAIDNGGSQPGNDFDWVRDGTPVIFADGQDQSERFPDGNYAIVRGIDRDEGFARLDRRMKFLDEHPERGEDLDVFVLVQQRDQNEDWDDPDWVLDRDVPSPAMKVMTFRTALRHSLEP